jgi:hypothetical protein
MLIITCVLVVANYVLSTFVRRNQLNFGIDFDDIDERFFDLLQQQNDQQNVHDSAVTSHITEAVKKLGPLVSPLDQVLAEIRGYLTSITHPRKNDSLEVFEHICDINMSHSLTNKNETEILALVWQRINHPVNQPHLGDLQESLVNQLADCKEDTSIVCGVGRISRVIQTLECLDAENIVNICPKWAITENIGTYCAKYTQKLLDQVPENYRQAINALERTPEQQKLATKFYQCVKNNLQKKFKLLYLDTHLLTQKQLDKLSKEYLANLE